MICSFSGVRMLVVGRWSLVSRRWSLVVRDSSFGHRYVSFAVVSIRRSFGSVNRERIGFC
jgi:hypothetical protein